MKILIADDSPTARITLRQTLERLGHEVVEAKDGLEALERLTRPDAPSMAILDWLMPGLDGPEVCTRIRELESAVPPYLMLLTMKDTKEDLLEGLSKGANDFVSKPYHEGELNARIQVAERTMELEGANRTLRMISECHQVMARVQNEQELAQQICRIIRRMGGYKVAWVGYAESGDAKTVRPVAWDGIEDGYLEQAGITWADEPKGRGPTGSCIRLREVRLNRDFQTEPDVAPWRDNALHHGHKSSLALPLVRRDQVFGALTIYSGRPDGFGQDQVSHLTELSNDLTLGIIAIRTRSERNEALAMADQRAMKLRALATELFQTEQRERQKLAQVLHDHIQQLLVAVKYGLVEISGRMPDEGGRSACGKVADTLNLAIQASRTLATELSPPALHEKGLLAALGWLGSRMSELHHLTVEISADQDSYPLPPPLRTFLFDAIRELLFNVVKHAGVNRAQVRLTESAGLFEVSVQDEGAGFDVGGITSDSGTGFGLFSIQERIGYLGGRMLVESTPGRGSCFRLIAPSGAGSEPLQVPENSAESTRVIPLPMPPNNSEGGQLKIRLILADDHPIVRRSLAFLLQNQPDLEIVAEASDGEEAVALAHRFRPDVILMDMHMPRLSGIEATRLISRVLPDIAVIGLSMHEDAAMANAILEVGAFAYVSKGEASEKLISAIRAAFQKGQSKFRRD